MRHEYLQTCNVFQCSCDPACDLPATGAQKSKFRRYQSVVCISIMPPPLVLTQLCKGYCRASALSTIVPLEVEEQEDVEEVEVEEFEAGLIVMALRMILVFPEPLLG